jgi:hypothetical protein
MRITASALTTEIKTLIDDGVVAGRIMPMPWMVQTILARHPVLYDPDRIGTSKCDSDFTELARREFVYAKVRAVLRLFKQDPDAMSPRRPGTEHLLQAYLFERMFDLVDPDADGEASTIVPIEHATDLELLRRADEYDTMAVGCSAHARELRDYVRRRRAA